MSNINFRKPKILIVDDDRAIHLFLSELLSSKFDLISAYNVDEALFEITQNFVDIVLLDLILGEQDGLDLVDAIKIKSESTDIIILSGIKDYKKIISVVRKGASEYVCKPVDKQDLMFTIDGVLQKRSLKKQNLVLKEELSQKTFEDCIVGESPKIKEVLRIIMLLREQNTNVLFMGETGTGKEVFARMLHQVERNQHRPFVSVNCAALPASLIESVLFGHTRGAFTGANENKIGKFELADGGDIFLDEINSLDLSLQGKLLRVLEEKEVERIGGKSSVKVNFRVIAASNESLYDKVNQGQFRMDLLYRLNTVVIQLPSLRDRKEDIIPLAEYFLKKLKKTAEPKILSMEVKEFLMEQEWRGNVRELRNMIENMIIFSKSNIIYLSDLPSSRREVPSNSAETISPNIFFKDSDLLEKNFDSSLQAYEKKLLLEYLQKNRWCKTKTSEDLKISRTKLYRKMSSLGIEI